MPLAEARAGCAEKNGVVVTGNNTGTDTPPGMVKGGTITQPAMVWQPLCPGIAGCSQSSQQGCCISIAAVIAPACGW